MGRAIDDAIDALAEQFHTINWELHDVAGTDGAEKQWLWLGSPDEQVMICVFRGTDIHEPFHRQDFFFFNYAWSGSFEAVSKKQGNRITVNQNEMVAGQPFTGYALDSSSNEEVVNVGVLIRKELFFRKFLPFISESHRLMHFFLDPENNAFSNEFLHVSARRGYPYRQLLSLMIVEYANGGPGSQEVLQMLAYALTMYMVRQYEEENPQAATGGTVEDAISWIAGHPENATLESTAAHLGYHPNYLSALLRKQTGKTFSQIKLDARMKRADLLLDSTQLTVEEVANMLGYSSTSNFYRAFRQHHGHSPRAEGETEV